MSRRKIFKILKQIRIYIYLFISKILSFLQAFQAGLQFMENREQHPEFRIPILVIPSTISNNVTGTDFSLGCDTALNEIVEVGILINLSELLRNNLFAIFL